MRRQRQTSVSLFVRLWVEISLSSYISSGRCCQPLREAVSWNTVEQYTYKGSDLVSLFVRLWVEISRKNATKEPNRSASSWGCELKYLIQCHERWRHQVSLFVRLWVEILQMEKMQLSSCQPLREAVSWNFDIPTDVQIYVVSLFVRLWVEIFTMVSGAIVPISQPLREAVSWNMIYYHWRWGKVKVSLFVRLWVEIWLHRNYS